MSRIKRLMTPVAVVGLAGLTSLAMAVPAGAATPSETTTYQATLSAVPLNVPDGSASGHAKIAIDGDQATVTVEVSGLAATIPTNKETLEAVGIPAAFAGKPYPHVQHIHIGGNKCPAPSVDANGDGAISTVEGVPAYGKVGTTLSLTGTTAASAATDVTVAPSGESYTYQRTFTLNGDTMTALQDGMAAVVVHGLDPATAPKSTLSTRNSLGLTLPGADEKVALLATAPALCGVLQVSQMTMTPVGASPTGGGSTAGMEDGWLFAAGGALIVAAAGVFFARRRFGLQQ